MFYENKKLAKLCTDEKEMRKGRADIADKLRKRIKALYAAETVGQLVDSDPLGKWHRLEANLNGLWAAKLSANYRLLVRPEGADDGRDAVTVTVIEISNHYDH